MRSSKKQSLSDLLHPEYKAELRQIDRKRDLLEAFMRKMGAFGGP
jgi:hypothetical protein